MSNSCIENDFQYLQIHITPFYIQSDVCIKTVGIVDKNGNCLGKILYLVTSWIWFGLLWFMLFCLLLWIRVNVVDHFRLLPRKIWVYTKVIRNEQCLWLQWRRLHGLLGVYLQCADSFKVWAVIKLKLHIFLIFVKWRIIFLLTL